MPASPQLPLVHAVILNWNRWTRTLECLASLRELDYPNREIIVVDNGSTDGSLEALQSPGGEWTLVPTGANLGYAGGNNVGIRHALARDAEFVWVLNNDTRVAPDALAEMVRLASSDHNIGVVASRQVEAGTGEQLPSGYRLHGNLSRAIALRNRAAVDGVGRSARATTEMIRCDGGCEDGFHGAGITEGPSLLISRAALAETGLFDERYFHYYEDTDLMLRIRQAGFRSVVACRSVVEHGFGESLFVQTPQAQYYMRRNELLFRRKNLGERPLVTLLREPRMVREAVAVRSALAGDLRPTRAGILALADGIRGRVGRRDLGSGYRVDHRPARLHTPAAGLQPAAQDQQ